MVHHFCLLFSLLFSVFVFSIVWLFLSGESVVDVVLVPVAVFLFAASLAYLRELPCS